MPVQNPVSYGLGLTPLNPAQNIMQGMQVGQGLLDAREQGLQNQQAALERPIALQESQLKLRTGLAAEADANANRSMQAAAQQSQVIRQQQMAEAMDAYLANPTPDAANKFLTEYPEHPLSKQYDKVIAARSQAQQEQDFSRSMQVTSAIQSGNTQAGIDLLNAEADKVEAAGDAATAKGLRDTAAMMEKNPQQVLGYLQGMQVKLAPQLGKSIADLKSVDSTVKKAEAEAEKADIEALGALPMLQAELGLKEAQAKRLSQQTALDWANLGLDKQKLSEEVAARIAKDRREDVALSEKQQGELAQSAINASTLGAVATMAGDAAKVFEARAASGEGKIMNTGVTADIGEGINKVLGDTGDMTAARLAYSQLVDDDIQTRAKESGNKLTDTDYAEQRKLYAPATGDFAPIAKQLRTFESRARKGSAVSGAKSAWLGANGNLAPASKPFVINGVVVERGQTFGDVVKKIDSKDRFLNLPPKAE